jgi:hypothetical protein
MLEYGTDRDAILLNFDYRDCKFIWHKGCLPRNKKIIYNLFNCEYNEYQWMQIHSNSMKGINP